MQSFIFAYGGKQLAEKMLGVQQAVGWDATQALWRERRAGSKGMLKARRSPKRPMPLASEIYLGMEPAAPTPPIVHP